MIRFCEQNTPGAPEFHFKRLLLQYPEGKPAAKLLSAESKDVKIFYSNWDQYFLEKGILYKSPEPANRTPRYVVPISFQKQVMYFIHNNYIMQCAYDA